MLSASLTFGDYAALSNWLPYVPKNKIKASDTIKYLSGNFSLFRSVVGQGQKFTSCGPVVLKRAEHFRRNHLGALFLHPPHHHTEVLRSYDYAYPLGVNAPLNHVRDLLRQPFLELQAARITVHEPSKLAHAEYFTARDVSYVTYAEKREHVMFAQAVDFNIPGNDHVVAFLTENRVLENALRVLMIARSKEFQALFGPFRGVLKAFPRRVFPKLFEHLTDKILHNWLLLCFCFCIDSAEQTNFCFVLNIEGKLFREDERRKT